VLSVPPFTASDCPFDILWSLFYLSLHLQFLIAPLKLFGHCVICPSSYSFWLPLWYLLVIMLSVPPFTASDCPFDIFWSLQSEDVNVETDNTMTKWYQRGQSEAVTGGTDNTIPKRYQRAIRSCPPFTAFDCPFGIFWSLCYLSLHLQLLIAPLISEAVNGGTDNTMTKRYQRGNQKP
jgi:hypothetical protein